MVQLIIGTDSGSDHWEEALPRWGSPAAGHQHASKELENREVAMKRRFQFRSALQGVGAALLAITASLTIARAEPPALPPELETVRAALSKYEDPIVAVRSGYLSTLGCVEYANGGMGVHFLNRGNIGPVPDPLKPQLLLYEPDGDKLRLVAAEWLIPLATGIKDRPTLFGQSFDGPMEGHKPLIPAELHHYDLHVWLFKPNPDGLFKAMNPTVTCAGKSGYAIMEVPAKQVAHPAH
jgi:hypothetical protein